MNNSTPLVSVFVITYNSASYIIETLDSVKHQTYKNLELVISDDCSTDNTMEICRAWLDENRKNFVRAELVSTPHNMGVAGNCNNAIRATTGVWLKGLSGDDKFLDYTIEEYVNYVNEHPECRICFAKLYFWGDDNELVNKSRNSYENFFYPHIRKSWKEQYKQILRSQYVPGPGLFFQKTLWEEVGGLDERYPFYEEYPFTFNVLSGGHRIFFIDEELYGYQIRENSLCREGGGQLLNQRAFWDFLAFFKDVRRKKMLENGFALHALHESISLYNRSLLYLNSSAEEVFFAKLLFLFSPIAYLRLWKRCTKWIISRFL